jgi:hypothetical protein
MTAAFALIFLFPEGADRVLGRGSHNCIQTEATEAEEEDEEASGTSVSVVAAVAR